MESKKKLYLIIAIAMFGLLVVGFVGMKETSKPEFCSTCHSMEVAFETWTESTHADVDCMSCHQDPGFAGFVEAKVGGLKEVAITLTRDVQPEDVVGISDVPDARCLACHTQESLEENVSGPHVSFHVSEDYSCMDCHDRVVHDPPEYAAPDMTQEACLMCHRRD